MRERPWTNPRRSRPSANLRERDIGGSIHVIRIPNISIVLNLSICLALYVRGPLCRPVSVGSNGQNSLPFQVRRRSIRFTLASFQQCGPSAGTPPPHSLSRRFRLVQAPWSICGMKLYLHQGAPLQGLQLRRCPLTHPCRKTAAKVYRWEVPTAIKGTHKMKPAP
jgi:hypothetical protein